MTLQKQVVPYVFGSGVDTGKEPKILEEGLTRLENGHFDRVGAITKRNGSSSITGSITAEWLAKYKNRLYAFGNDTIKAYRGSTAAGFSGSIDRYSMTDVEPQVLAATAGKSYYYPDSVINGNILVCSVSLYDGTNYTLMAFSFDMRTGELLASKTFTNGQASYMMHSKCVLVGSTAYIFYVNTSTVKLSYYTCSSSGAFSSSQTDLNGNPFHATKALWSFDAVVYGSDVYVAYVDHVDDIYIGKFTSGATYAATTNIVLGASATPAIWVIGSTIMVAYNAGGTIRAAGYNTSLSATVTDSDTGLNATTSLNLAGWATSATAGIIYLTDDPGAGDNVVHRCTVNIAVPASPTFGSDTEVARRVTLASKPFGSAADPHLVLHYVSTANTVSGTASERPTQAAYYVIDHSLDIVGKFYVGRAGDPCPTASVVLGHLWNNSASGSNYVLTGLVKTSMRQNPWVSYNYSNISADIALAMLTVDIASPTYCKTVEKDVLFIPSGCPMMFDEQVVVEQGFLQYPEGLTIGAVVADTGSPALEIGGTYGWLAVYEWQDAQGNWHQSCPSPPVSNTASLPASGYQSYVITVPTLTLTYKANVKIVLYRTLSNGSTYYRVATRDNSKTADSVTFNQTDTISAFQADSALQGTAAQPFVYTTGGIIENIQPHPYRVHCLHQNRHFYADRERESTHVRYSRKIETGDGCPWNDIYVIEVNADDGDITALASFQDRLVIFKENSIWLTGGTGYEANGAGLNYEEPILVSPAIGCIRQKTMVRLPQGLAFLSNKGICLLDNQFQVHPIGLPVKYHTENLTLTSAVLIPEMGYAIWTSSAGLALVYCYQFGQWATFTNHEATDAVEVDGLLYWKNSSTVYEESRSVYQDSGANYSLLIETGWFSLAKLLGYKRLYRIGLLGQNIAQHTLTLKLAYDFDPNWSETFTFESSSYTWDIEEYYTD